MPIDFRRGETSKRRLEVEWNYPVHAPDLEETVADGRTTAGRARAALPRERAIHEIRTTSRKPLLVVRECGFCKGTDDALLSRRMNNERTLVLAKWFHCVKLPNHVLDGDHPFRNLFADDKPPHLFLCRFDGTGVVAMDGQQTQSDLWDAMEELIAEEYEGDPRRAVRDLFRCLDAYDSIDSREAEVRRQLEETLDEDGPRSTKVRRLQRKLDELTAERAEVAEREAEVLDLGLRPLPDDAADHVPHAGR